MKGVERRFGWIPDLPDHRDLVCAIMPPVTGLPERVDLRAKSPGVYDQGSLGSCTANAIGAAHQFEQMRQQAKAFVPSRLFIYYEERVLMGTVRQDSGAYIRDGFKVIAKKGACPETQWPYVPAKFATKPAAPCYAEALKHQAIHYQRVTQTLDGIRAVLAAGHFVVFGFTVYESFQSQEVAKTGVVPMPRRGERALGGHAVAAVGYDTARRQFIVRNSWGTAWGDKGHAFFPFDYLTNDNLAADFWTVQLVEV